jgi:hypothetical protein
MSQNYVSPTTQGTSTPSADEPNIASNDDALLTNFSGATAPSSPVAGQHWFSTTNKILYVRNASNDGWDACANTQVFSGAGTLALGEQHDKSIILVKSTSTVTLPIESQVGTTWSVSLYQYDGTVTTINKNAGSGQSFYRDGTNKTSMTIPADNQNTLLMISKFTDGKFMISGNLKGVDSNLSSLTNAGKKVILDLVHPVGSCIELFSHVTPPLQGILGVNWVALSEGYAKVTGSTGNTGSTSGSNRIDTGVTNNHTLVLSQLPSVSMGVSGSAHFISLGDGTASSGTGLHNNPTVIPGASRNTPINYGHLSVGQKSIRQIQVPVTLSINHTTFPGGGGAHNHALNVRNYKLLTYRRTA